MVAWRISMVVSLGFLTLACAGGEEAPEVFEPEPQPSPAAEAPPSPAPVEAPAPAPTAESKPVAPKPKAKPAAPAAPAPAPAPAKVQPATVSFTGDAKDVWLIGDGTSGNYQAGEVPPGPYKIKAWFGVVPMIAGTVRIGAGETVVITCSAKKQRCERQ